MDSGVSEEDHEPTTQELKDRQAARESEERRQLAESGQPDEAKQHERRSEKAAYLKKKLTEREQAERDAESDR